MQSFPPNESAQGKHEALSQVNRQLENAIEQLRLANEAMAEAHRELHSLSSQIESMHHELEWLSHEIAHLRNGYAHTLDHVPYPVLLADAEGNVGVWNDAAQKLFGLERDRSIGLNLLEIPVQPSLRQIFGQKHQAVLERGGTSTLKNQLVQVKPALYRMDVHFTALASGVLMVFRDGLAGLEKPRKTNMVGSFAS